VPPRGPLAHGHRQLTAVKASSTKSAAGCVPAVPRARGAQRDRVSRRTAGASRATNTGKTSIRIRHDDMKPLTTGNHLESRAAAGGRDRALSPAITARVPNWTRHPLIGGTCVTAARDALALVFRRGSALSRVQGGSFRSSALRVEHQARVTRSVCASDVAGRAQARQAAGVGSAGGGWAH
jgi:hypothetical protein